MRAPLDVLLLPSVVGVAPASAQADGARRMTGHPGGAIELDSAAQSHTLGTTGFDMSRDKGFLANPIVITEITEKAVDCGAAGALRRRPLGVRVHEQQRRLPFASHARG